MNAQIYEEATQWLIWHREGTLDESTKRTFDKWLRTSPEHVRAYFEMSSTWEEVSSLGATCEADAEQLIVRARAADNIVPLETATRGDMPPPHPSRAKERPQPIRVARRGFAIAASIVLACSFAALAVWFQLYRAPSYATGIGEQRSIALADGSTLELNARSRVHVRFTEAERTVELLEGQALFRVVKDARRPFVVNSGLTRVQAIGTQFDVYRKQSGTVVTVLEGRVAVTPERQVKREKKIDRSCSAELQATTPACVEDMEFKAPPAIFLSTGEQLRVTPAVMEQPRRANVAAATSWIQRQLVFEASPLPEVAEEFNRYNTRQLIIEDPRLASFEVSGVFSSVDPSLLLKFLRAQSEILVSETEREIRITGK